MVPGSTISEWGSASDSVAMYVKFYDAIKVSLLDLAPGGDAATSAPAATPAPAAAAPGAGNTFQNVCLPALSKYDGKDYGVFAMLEKLWQKEISDLGLTVNVSDLLAALPVAGRKVCLRGGADLIVAGVLEVLREREKGDSRFGVFLVVTVFVEFFTFTRPPTSTLSEYFSLVAEHKRKTRMVAPPLLEPTPVGQPGSIVEGCSGSGGGGSQRFRTDFGLPIRLVPYSGGGSWCARMGARRAISLTSKR